VEVAVLVGIHVGVLVGVGLVNSPPQPVAQVEPTPPENREEHPAGQAGQPPAPPPVSSHVDAAVEQAQTQQPAASTSLGLPTIVRTAKVRDANVTASLCRTIGVPQLGGRSSGPEPVRLTAQPCPASLCHSRAKSAASQTEWDLERWQTEPREWKTRESAVRSTMMAALCRCFTQLGAARRIPIGRHAVEQPPRLVWLTRSGSDRRGLLLAGPQLSVLRRIGLPRCRAIGVGARRRRASQGCLVTVATRVTPSRFLCADALRSKVGRSYSR